MIAMVNIRSDVDGLSAESMSNGNCSLQDNDYTALKISAYSRRRLVIPGLVGPIPEKKSRSFLRANE
jgi:hypothetical protein